MALVACPDCGRQMSDSAPACLGCGRPMLAAGIVGQNAPLARTVPKGQGLVITGSVIIVLAIFAFFWNTVAGGVLILVGLTVFMAGRIQQ